jgi:molybdenum cofactor guanylyltransferase
MGTPKHNLLIDGEPLWRHISTIAHTVSNNVFISCRPDQEVEFDLPVIIDRYENIGPMGGILSAFDQLEDPSIIFLASDNPIIQREVLLDIIEENEISVMATCARVNESDYPEPLYSIWNRIAQGVLFEQQARAEFGLIKVLNKNGCKWIDISDLSATNINTEEDFADLIKRLEGPQSPLQ